MLWCVYLVQGKMSRRERRNWRDNQPPPGLSAPDEPVYNLRGSPTYEDEKGCVFNLPQPSVVLV